MIAKQGLAIALALVITFPGWAASDAIGTVASSESASIHGSGALPGSTIFSGDAISVGPRGKVWISLDGGAQVQLAANSQTRLVRSNKTIQLEVTRGEAIFRSSPQVSVEGLLGDALFQPAKSSPAVGLVAYANSNTAFLFAKQGNWILRTAHDGNSLLLRQGEGMEARIEPADQEQAGGSATNLPPKKRRSAFLTILIGGIIVAGATAAAFAASQSESHLSNQQKQNAISPFQFP